ncbi:hypothetical protein SADUNF_Sadunf02G0155700 [Salix dunnii]|uniref:Uncharacterized protein n=1 Tax=Salix dunnii TaxID=1413687 RepID=A0A835N7W2_9ROSI|nr:hypothetical protein SADUNF_Sadunf02G0155700 [Salix dunnii]
MDSGYPQLDIMNPDIAPSALHKGRYCLWLQGPNLGKAFLPQRSKQSAALGLPIPGASWPTSLQKFQASKATLKPSLLIPGSPTAVSCLAPETPSTITFTNKNTRSKWASIAISTRVLCLRNRSNRRYLYTSIRWGLSQQTSQPPSVFSSSFSRRTAGGR